MNKLKSDKLVVGVLAHVDAGKTTLAESMLYLSGRLRRLGRVDHRDTFLDTDEQERQRGITIFSKQAELTMGDRKVTLLDTPGHVDFSAEMERTLQVLDYAVLIVSGADGVQGHVETLWKLLASYRIPTFLFINKMDQEGTDRQRLLMELKSRLSGSCLDFSCTRDLSDVGESGALAQEFFENIAVCDESVMEYYLEHETVTTQQIVRLVKERKVFPCYFGSALKLTGVQEFMEGFLRYTECPVYPEAFGARIFKITRDAQGNRLTHMKITGGTLKVKALLSGQGTLSGKSHGAGALEQDRAAELDWEEKVDQIRIYSGTGYELCMEASAGTICTVTGLTKTFAGQGLGMEENVNLPILEPILNYRLELPEGCNAHTLLGQLRQLMEEEPLLHILWQEETGEIHAQLMGEVQIEVLKALIQERYGVEVNFGSGSIVYKETIIEPVEGVGHFEPLRHYAEVHLLLEPGEPGSGLQFLTDCSEDVLDRNWQRLVQTHLEEKKHRGVLTGSEITDMRITLIAGRAHPKHTEGGDFRQATYRAVRQGLRMAESRLLEPVYEYRLEVPADQLGRAMTDIRRMYGTFGEPEFTGGADHPAETAGASGGMAVLAGTAPAACIQGYQREVTEYTRGRGRLFCALKGYEPCHNEEEVISAIGYEPERDTDNPTGSVFCAHGAGFVVDYDKVYDYMHLPGVLAKKSGEVREDAQGNAEGNSARESNASGSNASRSSAGGAYVTDSYDDKELQAIFQRTYGTGSQERKGWARKTTYRREGSETSGETANRRGGSVRANDGTGKSVSDNVHSKGGSTQNSDKEYLLVDGYNIIFGWEELSSLARQNMEAARGRLMDILCNYQGYRKNELILVFDAYKVEGNPGSAQDYHNIHVVYTREAETADQYIEKVTHEIGRKYKVTVATSDALEQLIILGQGAGRMSAQGLRQEIEAANIEIRGELESRKEKGDKNFLFDNLPEAVAGEMENIRLGKPKKE